MTAGKQCLLDTARQLHSHSGCDNKHKVYASHSRSKSQHGEGCGHSISLLAEELLAVVSFRRGRVSFLEDCSL